jgi:hypothetical protein
MTVPHTTQPRFRLSAPPDLLASIPFLIGYHPSDSIVLLGMAEHRVTFTARDDLPPPGAPPPQQVAYLVEVLLRQGCRRVMLVGYGEEERVTPMMTALLHGFGEAEVAVLEALRADGERYWSYVCTSPRCCPPRGRAYDIGASEVAAMWTLAGRVARRDRDE